MHYIENLGLIHRDLAARNILMDKQKPCKIADFGLARAVAGGIYSPNPSKHISPYLKYFATKYMGGIHA